MRLSLLFLLAYSLFADTVYITAHGKTYHTNRQCATLARSKAVLVADDKDAIAHGLHQCSACAHKKKAAGNGWAKVEGK